MDEKPTGRGVIEQGPVFGNWKAGGETGIVPVVINPTGDWRPYKPSDEKQLMLASNGQSYGDTECCTNFSSTNVCEMLLNLSLPTLPQTHKDFLQNNGYIDANGKVNFSDRFDAYVTGTNPHVGNSLPAVWDGKKQFGMVPESVWPKPLAEWDALVAGNVFTAPDDFWAIYFKAPPQAALDLGKQFRQYFDIQYEWVSWPQNPLTMAQLGQELQKGPLQLATAVCAGWNTDDPIQGCGAGTAHATTMTFVEGDRYDIYDHYNPFQKQFAGNYSITYAMRGLVLPRSAPPVNPPFHYVFNINLTFGNPSNPPAEVTQLQKALQYLKAKSGQPYMKPGVFGPYGPATKAALGLFQTEHGIKDPGGQGSNFGPKTRTAINALLV